MIFTALSIDELISCKKLITELPTREFKEENRHRRKDMRLRDETDLKRVFSVFIRQSLEFSEDFSLGLVYLSTDGKRMTIVRYNGQHEQTNDPYDLAKTHFQYHIHKATPENLNNGRYEKHPAAATAAYASFEEAMFEFFAAIGLAAEEISANFPGLGSLPLFRNLSRST